MEFIINIFFQLTYYIHLERFFNFRMIYLFHIIIIKIEAYRIVYFYF